MKDLPCEFKELEELLDVSDRVILYGAHRIAEDTLKVLHYYGWENKDCVFAVTDQRENRTCLCGLPVRELWEYENIDKKKTLVIVAMPEKFFSEVTENLKKHGYQNIYYVGGRQLAYWENQETIGVINRMFPQLCAVQDPDEHLCLQLTLNGFRYRFMPLGIFPLSQSYMQMFTGIDNLWNYCGNPKELRNFTGNEKPKLQKMEERTYVRGKDHFQIYAASSPKDSPISEEMPFMSWEVPVIGGAALTDLRSGAGCDNEGDNISSQNRRYAEMTVAYWAWKNSAADYIGLEHYRRRYLLSEEQLETVIFQNIDAVLTRPRIVLPNIREWFARVSSLSERDIDRLAKWMEKRLPMDRQSIQEYFSGNVFYPNNMVIAKRDVYGEYCQWLFGILTAFDEEPEFDDIHKKGRCDAYIAELLTSLYFILNQQRYRLAITDYRLLA